MAFVMGKLADLICTEVSYFHWP